MKSSNNVVEDCFPEVRKSIISGKGKQSEIIDYKLSRYACYLIVQNGDPKKEVIVLCPTYFAVQTRKQEITEEEKRLYTRINVNNKNKKLFVTAEKAGVKKI